MHEITLRLDERNLAHVLTALALSGIADEMEGASPDARCWWTDDAFKLLIPHDQNALFAKAHAFVKSIRWVAGIGCNEKPTGKLALEASAHHGLFVAESGHSGNPLLSYHDQGVTSSIFKTFSGQQSPAGPLGKQQAALKNNLGEWLFQRATDAGSRWNLDCRVASHAYDLGFGSNEDQSGDRDPFYPAIELLSIAGASFFAASHAWLIQAEKLTYCIWSQSISLSLAPLAATMVPQSPQKRTSAQAEKTHVRWASGSLLDGLDCRYHQLATRGNAYGKGAAYRHFPEASLITQINNQ
jgi:hypothetical protein